MLVRRTTCMGRVPLYLNVRRITNKCNDFCLHEGHISLYARQNHKLVQFAPSSPHEALLNGASQCSDKASVGFNRSYCYHGRYGLG